MKKNTTPVAFILLALTATLLPGLLSATEMTGKEIAFDRSKDRKSVV